ncbi:MAG: leucine-rich repeat protein, partial [Bacteroidales bacterium]|nr:leucine-rich repeat protein [Bacteroidales bacterium]
VDGRCLIVDGCLTAFAPYDVASYTIPEGVASIGERAFYVCSSLTSVVIPDSVTSIGPRAFAYCTTLSKIECKSQTPPTAGKDMFEDTNNCPIYVPNESVEAYKAAPGWSDYADRIFGIVE